MNNKKLEVKHSETWTYIKVDDYIVNMVKYGEPTLGDIMDIHVNFEDGRHYVASFFKLEGIIKSMKAAKETGESANGIYFWDSDMIIVQELTYETICKTIADLFAWSLFEDAFCLLVEEEPAYTSADIFNRYRDLE